MTLLKKVMSRRSFLSKLLELMALPVLLLLSVIAGYRQKRIDIGIGPEPLITNIYHKKAFQQFGYTCETFVMGTYFITSDFDLNIGKKRCDILPAVWRALYLFIRVIFNYRVLFIYFNGGPLFVTNFLYPLEPFLLKLAKVKVIVLPYGSDVQDMLLSKNLYFRHVTSQDYPLQFRNYKRVRKNIERWTDAADWVISGVEWVDYMHHWNTLQLGHFAIDTERWKPQRSVEQASQSFKILHAPNHTAIKGTQALKNAVEQLRTEGLDIELVLLQKVPNEEIQKAISTVDLVADQFVVGWYAMFALEAMSLEKPVLCYLRQDLVELYIKAGLVKPGEIPLINTDFTEIADKIRWAYNHREQLRILGKRGREFVMKHHSLEYIGSEFTSILKNMGVFPQECRRTVVSLEEYTNGGNPDSHLVSSKR